MVRKKGVIMTDHAEVEATEPLDNLEATDIAQLPEDKLEALLKGEEVDLEEPDEPETEDAEEPEPEAEAPDEEAPEAEEEGEPEEEEDDKPEPGSDWEAKYKNLEWKLGQQARELGDRRQRTEELEALIQNFISKKPDTEVDDDDWENPRAVARDEYARMRAEETLNRQKQHEAIQNNRNTILQFYPDFNEDLVWEAVRSDGVSDEDIQVMKDQLWQSSPVLVHAQYQRGLMIKQLKELEAKNAELEDRLKNKSKRISENIKKASKRRAPKTQMVAGDDDNLDVNPQEIHKLSSAEIEELLKRRMRNG